MQSQPGKLHGVAEMLEKGMVARKVEMGPEMDAMGNMKTGKRNIKGQKPLAVPPITSAKLRSRGYTGGSFVDEKLTTEICQIHGELLTGEDGRWLGVR